MSSMIPVLAGQNFDNAADFVNALNKARLANKKKWLTYQGTVNGKQLALKTFDVGYLQICDVDGFSNTPPMDISVTEWKNHLLKALG